MRSLEFLIEAEIEENVEFSIPAENWGKLQVDIEKLNRKGAKIGAAPILINVIKEITKDVKTRSGVYPQKYYIVTVDGKAPVIDGWKLLAAIDHEGGMTIVRAVPGENIPTEFRNADPKRCDHCNVHRGRNQSFIIQHDNSEIKQVGRSCLKNFLGHKDPKHIVSWAQMLVNLDDIMDSSQSEGSGGGGNYPYDLGTYLAFVSSVIENQGWVSKGNANEDQMPTSYVASSWMNPYSKYDREARILPTAKNVEIAKAAIKWVREELPLKNNLSEYEHNITKIGKGDSFDSKYSGYVASIVPAHERFKNNATKYAKVNNEKQLQSEASEYVGEVGHRFGAKKNPPLTLQFLSVRKFETQYGISGIYKFKDAAGNFFAWFSGSSPQIEEEKWYEFAASVKNHTTDKYNKEAKTTYLTRMKKLKDL